MNREKRRASIMATKRVKKTPDRVNRFTVHGSWFMVHGSWFMVDNLRIRPKKLW
jgi:hypothetical protein